jgi:hypothetical protein
MMVVRLAALRTGSLYPPGNIRGTHLFEAESTTGPQGGLKDYVNKKFQ